MWKEKGKRKRKEEVELVKQVQSKDFRKEVAAVNRSDLLGGSYLCKVTTSHRQQGTVPGSVATTSSAYLFPGCLQLWQILNQFSNMSTSIRVEILHHYWRRSTNHLPQPGWGSSIRVWKSYSSGRKFILCTEHFPLPSCFSC